VFEKLGWQLGFGAARGKIRIAMNVDQEAARLSAFCGALALAMFLLDWTETGPGILTMAPLAVAKMFALGVTLGAAAFCAAYLALTLSLRRRPPKS
jgi:hypothetical protein